MQNNKNEINCLCSEIENLKVSCLMLCAISRTLREIDLFASYLCAYFSEKSVCRFLFSYVLAYGVLLYQERKHLKVIDFPYFHDFYMIIMIGSDAALQPSDLESLGTRIRENHSGNYSISR